MALSTKVDFIKDRFDPFTEIYSPSNISDEQHTIPSSSPFYVRTKEVVKEDSPSSIEIWTGAGKTGTQYIEVSSAPGPGEFQVDYKFQSGYIRFNEANANTTIYITYKGLGDVIQAAHINTVQTAIQYILLTLAKMLGGTYIGNGVDGRDINCPFAPSFVLILHETDKQLHLHVTVGMSSKEHLIIGAECYFETDGGITPGVNKFTVWTGGVAGSSCNESDDIYHWIAIKESC